MSRYERNSYIIFQFSISIFQTNDPSVAINLILILREAIQAKTSWRGSTLVQILKVNATEAIGKLLVRVHKMQIMQHQPLADHILICMFWILSALATKGKKPLTSKSKYFWHQIFYESFIICKCKNEKDPDYMKYWRK